MPKGICRVCGCTDSTPCMTESGPCSWVCDDLCDACVICVDGNPARLIPKACAFCALLLEGKPWKMKTTWTCSKGRFDTGRWLHGPGHQWFAWGGVWKPNKMVKAAQKGCPFFAVYSQFDNVNRSGRPTEVTP